VTTLSKYDCLFWWSKFRFVKRKSN